MHLLARFTGVEPLIDVPLIPQPTNDEGDSRATTGPVMPLTLSPYTRRPANQSRSCGPLQHTQPSVELSSGLPPI